MKDFLELRVHGVHGTSPGSMLGLGDDEVRQVAGDALTGIYRPAPGSELPLRTLQVGEADRPTARVTVEAYSWGALTSAIRGVLGWVRRVGWLSMLPFALANLAYWARLGVGDPGRVGRLGSGAVRVSALMLTVFMVLTPCVIGIDMLGWQCFRGGGPRCSHLPGQLDFLANWAPTQRLLATSLVPTLVVLFVGVLSRQTISTYEKVSPDYASTGFASGSTDALVLRRRFLWSAWERTQRLQRLHLTAALATIVGFVGAHTLHTLPEEVAGQSPRFTIPRLDWDIPLEPAIWTTTVLAAAAFALSLVLVAVEHQDDLEKPAERNKVADWLGRKAPASAVYAGMWAVLVAQGFALYRYKDGLDETSSEYFGHNVWFIAIFVVLTGLHLCVFGGERMALPGVLAGVLLPLVAGSAAAVVLSSGDHHIAGRSLAWALVLVGVWWVGLVVWHYRFGGRTREAMAWGGASASVLLAAAAWVGLLFTSSLVTAFGNYLNGPDRSVADLVTETQPDRTIQPAPFAATGDVGVRKARIVVTPSEVLVLYGTVTADEFTRVGTGADVAERVGTLPLHGRAPLEVSGGDLAVEQTCVFRAVTDQKSCSASSGAYWESGEVHLDGRTLKVDPTPLRGHRKGRVTLQPSEPVETPIVVPQVLVWTPLGQLLWLVLVAFVAAACVSRYRRLAGAEIREAIEAGTPGAPDDQIPEQDRLIAGQHRWAAGLAHRAEAILDVVGLITAPVALAITVFSLTGRAPWDVEHLAWTRGVATVAMYLMLAATAGLVLIGSHLRRSESARKAVGVIWDLATFWPRAAHPLAPPCYAERVVPELDLRTRWALGVGPDGQCHDETKQDNEVILSGHSQGSLIVVAMASRLEDSTLKRVRIITYGSQVRALYGRVFPAVFGPDAVGYWATSGPTTLVAAAPDAGSPPGLPPTSDLGPGYALSLAARLEAAHGLPVDGDAAPVAPPWINLFRRTDPLGFRVFSDREGVLDLPVPEVPAAAYGDPGPYVRTHSGYQHTLTYRQVVCTWTGEQLFEVTRPVGVADMPFLPRS